MTHQETPPPPPPPPSPPLVPGQRWASIPARIAGWVLSLVDRVFR